MRLPHKGRTLTITSFAAVGVLVAGGIAWAAIPDTDGTIHGCYAKSGGSVKVIDTAKTKTCPTGYLPLEWNQQGIPGIDGADGRDGTNGTDGVDGQSPVEIATWNFANPGNLDSYVFLKTQQSIAGGDKVLGTDATLTGMEGCYSGVVQLSLENRKDPGINSGVLAQWSVVNGAIVTSDADALIGTEWVQGRPCTSSSGLTAFTSCTDADFNRITTPYFEGSVTLRWTHVPPQVEIQ